MFKLIKEWFYSPTVIDLVRQERYKEASAWADHVAILAAKNNEPWIFDQAKREINKTSVKTVWNDCSWGNLAAIVYYCQDNTVKQLVIAQLMLALSFIDE